MGGFGVSNAVLTRFYSLHYLIPFILAGLMLVHLIALHEGGSGNLAGVRSDVDKIPFYPHYAIKDFWRGVVLIVGVFVFAGGFPYLLGDLENFKGADPLVTPEHIQPEWYFLFAYAILRSIPSKLGGVVALVSSLLVLFLVPFLSSNQRKGLRPLSRILF
ncbi:MAG: Cytochrome b/c1 [Chlamydiia bacterium]|nr:Cytochrome b/c1 [Chlamydiia bacterium]